MTVTDWLLDSDPSIRWQVLRDLTDAPARDVATERSRVATEGWGARLLAAQDLDGRWSGGTFYPEWVSTEATLRLLRDLGLAPSSDEARRAVAPVHEAARWEYDPALRFFEGSTRGSSDTTINVLEGLLEYERSTGPDDDVARVFDHLRAARAEPDERMDEALDLLASKSGADGRWRLERARHPRLLVDLGEAEGGPSRWITLRALRVLHWAGR